MDDKNISNQEKKAPLGVKIIAIVLFIFLVFYICTNIFFIISAFNESTREIVSIYGPTLIELIVLILITCLLLFVDIMFWKGKNWARIILLIFFAIVMSLSLWTLIMSYSLSYSSSLKDQVLGYLTCIIELLFPLIAWIYLLFNKKCEEFFKK